MPKGKRKKWTDKQIAYLVVKKTQGKTFPEISKGLAKKFPNEGFENMHFNTLVHQWRVINETTGHTFNQKEVDFVYASMLNNFPTKKIIQGFYEQFNRKITEKAINSVINKRKTTLLIEHENKVEKEIAKAAKKIKKEVKKMKKGQWTTTENKKLMKCKDRQEVLALAMKLNRSPSSAYQKWYVARKSQKVVKEIATKLADSKKTIKVEKTTKAKKTTKKTTKPKKVYSPRWTEEEDFDLLCNFYEYSIDEARNAFNRPYGAIATRLEKLVDSTQPKHEEMLMRAAKEIKERKQAESKPVKMSRKQRRKAKKEAKIHRRMARLHNQLKGE